MNKMVVMVSILKRSLSECAISFLNKESNEPINHKRVQRIMHELGIFGIQGKNGKYHSYKNDNGEPKENLLLEKVIDEDKHRTTYKLLFLRKNGTQTRTIKKEENCPNCGAPTTITSYFIIISLIL